MKIGKYCDLFKKKHGLSNATKLADIISFFEALEDGIRSKDILSIIIADYLFRNISSEEVRKRKVTARDFEDFLAMALGGKVMDNASRNNDIIEGIRSGTTPSISRYISSNRREKMDVMFERGYGISVKTSVPNNEEINMGSFAREALFEGLLEEYGSERKGGLGSRPQLEGLFSKIAGKNKWRQFASRFNLMVMNIYVDDLLFAIKGGRVLTIYFVPGKDMRKILINAVKGGPKKAVEVLNRYEGNSLRVERDKIISAGKKIELDFSDLENTKVRRVLNRLSKIEEMALDSMVKNDVKEFEKFLAKELGDLIQEMKYA